MSTRRNLGYDRIIPVVGMIVISEIQCIIQKTADFSIVVFNSLSVLGGICCTRVLKDQVLLIVLMCFI